MSSQLGPVYQGMLDADMTGIVIVSMRHVSKKTCQCSTGQVLNDIDH